MTPNDSHIYDTIIKMSADITKIMNAGFNSVNRKLDDHIQSTDEKMERKIEAHFKDVHIPENKEIHTYVKTIAAALFLILILHIVGVLPAALDLIKGIF